MARSLGTSITETARLVGCSRSAVVSIHTKWINDGDTSSRGQGVGRPRVIKGKGRRRLSRLIMVPLNIIADQLHPYMAFVFPTGNGIFQQDNAPCHKARIVLEWFNEHTDEFHLMYWPPKLPDLNPIENI
ncbi:hypothetical protein AVEN_4541-1 [Araneus ventricosus]|uniref:Tc1-like transposase DDE domain-containing protein n=1 Tax=Araneus ventricosus TaxID=182803 RepID=A0A4Y2BN35_ARAVE|nr:hypothetical protein AVEN_4541-1 [Araneus ventricosus]